MTDKNVRALIHDDNVAIVKKSRKSIYGRIIYYVFGAVLSLTFLFPIF